MYCTQASPKAGKLNQPSYQLKRAKAHKAFDTSYGTTLPLLQGLPWLVLLPVK